MAQMGGSNFNLILIESNRKKSLKILSKTNWPDKLYRVLTHPQLVEIQVSSDYDPQG